MINNFYVQLGFEYDTLSEAITHLNRLHDENYFNVDLAKETRRTEEDLNRVSLDDICDTAKTLPLDDLSFLDFEITEKRRNRIKPLWFKHVYIYYDHDFGVYHAYFDHFLD